MSDELNQSRFVVLRHDVGPWLSRTPDAHFDWMFQTGETLRTWASPTFASFDQSMELDCECLPDHRLAYLDFQGDIDPGDAAGGRGRVTRLIGGFYDLVVDREDRFTARLRWRNGGECLATVTFYRSLLGDVRCRSETGELWRLRFSRGR